MKRRYPLVTLCWKQVALLRRQEKDIQRVLKAYRIVVADRDLLQRELDGWTSTLEQIEHLPETEEPVRHPFDDELELPQWPDAERLSKLEMLLDGMREVQPHTEFAEAETVNDWIEDHGYRIVKA